MRLENGQRFPTVVASRVGGGRLTIPEDLAGQWGILLFYRGHTCAYCKRQLVDFQNLIQPIEKSGVRVIALSMDGEEKARKTAEEYELTFPLLYGLDRREIVRRIGVRANSDLSRLQSAGFVIRPDGAVAQAVYSSGALGRLLATDTLEMIKDLQKRQHV